jgi:hypothetical protein
MQTHRFFLHDIIVNDCRHELPSTDQIHSNKSIKLNRQQTSSETLQHRREHEHFMGTTILSNQSWQISNEADSKMRKSQYYHRWCSFRIIPNETHWWNRQHPADLDRSISATSTSRFYSGGLRFDSSLGYWQPQHVLCNFLQYLSWRQVPSTPFPSFTAIISPERHYKHMQLQNS